MCGVSVNRHMITNSVFVCLWRSFSGALRPKPFWGLVSLPREGPEKGMPTRPASGGRRNETRTLFGRAAAPAGPPTDWELETLVRATCCSGVLWPRARRRSSSSDAGCAVVPPRVRANGGALLGAVCSPSDLGPMARTAFRRCPVTPAMVQQDVAERLVDIRAPPDVRGRRLCQVGWLSVVASTRRLHTAVVLLSPISPRAVRHTGARDSGPRVSSRYRAVADGSPNSGTTPA